MEIKKIALNDTHEALGAKMVDFAGYNMPVRYTSDLEEHHQVRDNVGVFDVSHMGEFMVTGPKAIELIQKISSNDASKLFDGKAQYSCIMNPEGGIVDDFLVYRFNEEKYLLVVNASNIEKDWNWISAQNTMGATMENISDQTSLFAIQGPKATEVLQKLTDVTLSDMGYYTFTQGTFAGEKDVIISATGYTGSGGFEIYVPNASAQKVWDAIFEAGKDAGIKPVGLAARDTLRLEMGFCLYGNDIDDTTTPLEAGLGWITKLKKGDFIGSDKLVKQKEAGLSKKLIGFILSDRGIPRSHYPIVNSEGKKIGEVTSGTMSPVLKQGVGMGYVEIAYAEPDSEIFIEVRNRKLKAIVKKAPFIN
ncbi:glycine cleavage system aminomethyltransferase GcvT [Chondrinema litorale]|uniref:glycine cleavage system aminomethyltransferase GcvT n=1 Tax=Chondrinema litorale TaxID=2994555 RepID=UPI00254494D2|nr:glycine cleavage system aminomethyltransferase GcvT [Chondrinema litorale]UZR94803.1 glycine cleavage system aminomethyltransferase GcvT [Chondrinema litorale]